MLRTAAAIVLLSLCGCTLPLFILCRWSARSCFRDVGKTEPIKVGKASPTEGTLPGSVYFIAKYEGNFAAAAQANAEVGGDNAARAVAIGMVMGAAQGLQGIPEGLGMGHLKEWEAADALLNQLPLVKEARSRAEANGSGGVVEEL